MPSPTFNELKFRELVLYVAGKSLNDPRFGATKLNKILFFSDFAAYGELGKPITGATYQKLDKGPAPREMLPTLRIMTAEGDAVRIEQPVYGLVQKRVVPLREADLTGFSSAEIDIVNTVLWELADHTAAEVSDLSHRVSVGWRLAYMNEAIPYETFFLSDGPPSEADIERGWELAREYGWVG